MKQFKVKDIDMVLLSNLTGASNWICYHVFLKLSTKHKEEVLNEREIKYITEEVSHGFYNGV